MRVYATTEDYKNFLHVDDVPVGAERLLERASEDIDTVLVGAFYPTDENYMPLDPIDIETMMRATCAQAQYISDLDDESGAKENFQSMSVGSVSLTRNSGGNSSNSQPAMRYSPRAVNILRVSGLLPANVFLIG